MKNNLKLIIIFVLLFTTGCSVNYDLKINKDLSIEESFVAFDTRENLKEKQYNSFDAMIKSNEKLTTVNTDLYDIKNYKKNNLLGATVKRKYNSIKEYISQINKYDLFLVNATYTINSDIATIKFSSIYEQNEEFASIFYNVDANVNIYIPFEVSEHNADSFDSKKNIYTWSLNNYSNDNKEFYVSFNTKKRKYDFNLLYKIVPIISIMTVVVLFLKVRSSSSDRI